MGEQIDMLGSLSTLEISNVKRPANRKTFAITKSEFVMNPKIKAVLSVKAEGEDQFISTLKSAGASAERIDAATASYRIRKGFADVLKSEDLDSSPKPDETKKMEGETEEQYKERMEKMEEEEKARKVEEEEGKSKKAEEEDNEDVSVKSADADMARKVEALYKSNQTLAKTVKNLVEKNEHLEYTAVAKSKFPFVKGTPEEIAKTLKSAHDAGPEAEKQILDVLRSANEVVAKSQSLAEMGSTGGGMAGGAHDKIMALASDLVIKNEDGSAMSDAQRYAYVIKSTKEGRDLYAEYCSEKSQLIKNS